MTKIAIIGAGISGMSCAWHLQKLLPHAEIDLIESSERVGGVIQTHYESPYLAELGADNIATLVPDGLRWIEEMGLRDEFVTPNPEHRFAQVVHAGKVYPIPNGFSLMQPTQMAAILASPLLSWSGRLRILGEYFVRPRVSSEDESVESFAVRRLGRECFDRLVEPIVGGIFTARAETLSMHATMAQFVAMEKEHGSLIRAALAKRKSENQADKTARKATGARYDQFIAPKQGMTWWMKTISERLKATKHFSTKVQSVVKNAEGSWELKSNNSALDRAAYNAVCLATPSWVSSDILKVANPKASALLDRIPYASSAVAILAIPKSEIRPSAMCFGIVVPKVENREALAISLTSEKYAGRSPNDTVLARVFMGGAIRPELLDQSDEALLAIARKEVRELLGVQSHPRWQQLVRWNDAMPQYLLGHNQTVREIRESLDSTPTLQVVGNAFDGVGIPQCIRLAKLTAEKLAKVLALMLIACCLSSIFLTVAQAATVHSQNESETAADKRIRDVFAEVHDGWSVDEVLLHDERRAKFLQAIKATPEWKDASDRDCMARLLQLRKGDKLEVKATRRADSDVSDFLVAAEIASRLMSDRHNMGPDQWLVDPKMLAEFDAIGLEIAKSDDRYSLRKAAIKLRKSRALRPELLQRVTDWHVTIQQMPLQEAKLQLDAIPEQPGVYIFRDSTGYLYIGQSNRLRTRLTKHLEDSDRKALVQYLGDADPSDITLELHVFGPDSPATATVAREAYESELIRSRKPRLNIAP